MPPLTPRARLHTTRLLGAVLATSLLACGGEPTEPGGDGAAGAGIHFVAGANVTDTVDAAPALALRVVVRDAAGQVMPGVVVRFTALPIVQPGGYPVPSMSVGGLGTLGISTFQAETTSAQGVASVRVVMGRVAGEGRVLVAVPEAGYQDTAHFTIRPGNPAKVILPVTDTALQVGRAITLAGRVEDRYANARADAVTYEVTGTQLTLTGSSLVGAEPTRARVLGRFGALVPDTTWISVVPAATIASFRNYKLLTVSLDGTGLTQIAHTLEVQDPGPEWHPDGKSLLTLLGTFGGPRALYNVKLDGTTQEVTNSTTLPGYVYSGTYSPDGQWVYASHGTCNYAAIISRVQVANPLQVERLSPVGPDECFELVNHWPSISPDGTRMTYENQTWNQSGYSVRVMDLATRAVTEIATGGQRPSWSPAGNVIAYWQNKQIWVIKPDGTGARGVSPTNHSYLPGVRWSPDGQWMLARFEPTAQWAGTTVALINVNTGLELPLPWTTGYGTIGLPAWKPR